MKIKVISSGSSGNCTYLEINKKKFLIDIGISYLKVKNILSTINVDILSIDYLLITHSHKDHVGGLQTLLKNTKIKLLLPDEVYNDLKNIYEIKNYNILEDENIIDEISIDLIHNSHDVPSYGFIINNQLVYITDTGYLNRKYIDKIKDKEIYIFESNHDEKMLMEGPYPYVLKQRVISDKGHMSNKYAGSFLSKCIGKNTKYVILAHISKHNNTEELAVNQVKEELGDMANNIIIIPAHQDISLDEIEV